MKKFLSLAIIVMLCLTGCGKSPEQEPNHQESENTNVEEKKISIVNLESNSRPYAVVVNNSSVAVKVQTGLQQAYLVYEFPVEGGLTRLMALYKDIDDLKIGTVRSARHNFLDYAMEHDAIFVHFGWSHYAEDDEQKLKYNYINGLFGGPFWRENPEHLASEHTAYTSMKKLKEYTSTKGYSTTTDKGLVLDYSIDEIDLSKKEKTSSANKVYIPSNGTLNTTYNYDTEKKVYKRSVNGNPNIDYETKEQYTTKNIIIQKIKTKMASDNHYWDLGTTGSGEGYFITNGFAVPIKWSKKSREAKTKYTYLDGNEIILNDGNTFIQLQSTNQKTTIE